MNRVLRTGVLSGGLGLMVILGLAAVLRLGMTNLGAITWSGIVWQAQPALSPHTYPIFDAPAGRASTATLLTALAQVQRLTGLSVSSGLAGRLALLAGDVAGAEQALSVTDEALHHNPMQYHDTILSLSLAGHPQQVVALFSAVQPPEASRTISDVVALAHLDLGLAAIQRGDQATGIAQLNSALVLRPFDLMANGILTELNDADSVTQYRHAIGEFPISAVRPGHARLVRLVTRAIPQLVQTGLWDKALAVRVTGYVVWRYASEPEVEAMLHELNATEPQEPHWLTLLGQWYFQRGDWAQAVAADQAAVTLDGHNLESIRRIGLGYEYQGEVMAAAEWYERYLAIAPDDAVVRAAWLRMLESEQRPGVDEERRKWQQRMEPLTAVEEAWQFPVETIQLGDNMLLNGTFESVVNRRPRGWKAADYATYNGTDQTLRAAVDGGVDASTDITTSIRIDGLWMQPEQRGFYGFVTNDEPSGSSYTVDVRPQHGYILTGLYRTAGTAERANVYLGNSTTSLWDETLPATEQQWRRLFVMGCYTGATLEPAQLVVRLFGVGTVWFSDLQLRPIEALTGTVPCGSAKSLVR